MHISPYVEPRSRHSVLLSVGRLRGELSGSREPITLRRTQAAIRPRDRSRNGSPGLCPEDRTEIRRFKLRRRIAKQPTRNVSARPPPSAARPVVGHNPPPAKAFSGLRARMLPAAKQGPTRDLLEHPNFPGWRRFVIGSRSQSRGAIPGAANHPLPHPPGRTSAPVAPSPRTTGCPLTPLSPAASPAANAALTHTSR